jgi:hypothetical protein
MFDLPHQQARALIQSAADQIIDSDQKTALDAHLSICKECSDYAKSIKNLEANLRNTLRARWEPQRPALDLYQIANPSPGRIIWSSITNFSQSMGRITVIAALFLGCLLIANHFGIQMPIAHTSSPTTIPTPSDDGLLISNSPTPSITTRTTLNNQTAQVCFDDIYYVQKPEDIGSIALSLGISAEMILEHNQITTEIINPGTKLFIPHCTRTPSWTASDSLSITPGNVKGFTAEPE